MTANDNLTVPCWGCARPGRAAPLAAGQGSGRTPRPLTPRRTSAGRSKGTEAILALGVDSRKRVDELVDEALTSGGPPSNDTNDQVFMYGRSFQDLDGHLWEILHMDPTAGAASTG